MIWSDAGDWERFETVWHDDGYMSATWFEGPAKEFIRKRREGWERGVNIIHSLGGSSIDVVKNRAISQTKMQISQRASMQDVLCDVVCTGRFYDFFERRKRRWGMVFRQPIYEKDRIDPVDSSKVVKLDGALLNSFPEGYRHLAYLQTVIGYNVRGVRPGLKGPEIEQLYTQGKRWLDGDELSILPK